MKTLFTICVLLVISIGCTFDATGLNVPPDNMLLSGEITDEEVAGDTLGGEVEEIDFYQPDVTEATDTMDEDSSEKHDIMPDDELVMPEIPDTPDITDTGTDPPDAPDIWPDAPDVQQENYADETAQDPDVEEIGEEVEIVEVVDSCKGDPCDDGNVCTEDFCVQNTGECVYDIIVECCLADEECTDDDTCNGAETCVGNKCQQGQALNCDDGNICTDDSCNWFKGCVFTTNLEPCDDNDPCTADDVCDENAQCAGKLWCICFSDADCLDDGDKCNGTHKCQGNFCVVDQETVVDCADDDDPCTDDSCDPDTGECVYKSVDGCCNIDAECDDNNVCNGAETCMDNKCQQGQALKCDDNNVCTDDACVLDNGCVYTPNNEPCDDSDPCTINDTCLNKACVGKLVPCECQSTADCAKLEDGNLCNGTLKCVQMVCVIDQTTIIKCSPTGDPCTVNICNHDTGKCEISDVNGNACDDGDICTTGDTCFNGACQPGAPVLCDDGNECTGDICVPAVGCMSFNMPNNTPCDDKDACTKSDTCQTGKCKGGPLIICEDNNPCTINTCDKTIGCVNAQIPECCVADLDCDGVVDDKDNCPPIANYDQADMDKDGIGDACDTVNTCKLSTGGLPPIYYQISPLCLNSCLVDNQMVCVKCVNSHNNCTGNNDGDEAGSACQGDCNDGAEGSLYECWPGGISPPACADSPWTPQ